MKYKIVIILLFLLSTQFLLLLQSTFSESPVYDEPIQIGVAERFFFHQDFQADTINPPLTREIVGLPLLLNKDLTNDPVLFWFRLPVIITTLLLGLIVFLFAKKLYGQTPGIFALLLYTFDPNILAHGHYATTDLIFTFFFILSLYLFYLKRWSLLAVSLGLGLSAKLSTLLFLFPSLIFLTKSFNLKKIIVGSFITLAVLWSTYFFLSEPILGNRQDNRHRPAAVILQKYPILNLSVPFGGYISTVKQDFLYINTNAYHKRAFLLGQISEKGFWYFFPVAILLKTPIPLLILFLWAMTKSKDKILLVSLGIILLASLFSQLNLGLRHVLPIYPLSIIFVSQLAKTKNIFIISLAIWLIVKTLSFSPHYLSYFNEFIGNPNNGYKYLVDSNLDWGQGLIALARYQKENNIPALNLSYFGMADPQKYGIKTSTQSKIYAISATNYWYENFYKNPQLIGVKPDKIIGGSILIFN